MKPARHRATKSPAIRRTRDGWGPEEKRKLLVGIERGVWTLSGAAHRFCLAQDEIALWQRSASELPRPDHPDSGSERYVELI